LGDKEDNLQFLEKYITEVANETSYDARDAFWRDFRYRTAIELRNDYLQYLQDVEYLNKTLRKKYIQSRRKQQERFQKQKDVLKKSQLQKKRSKQKEILSSIFLDPNVFQSVLHMKEDPYSLLTEYM
jgi:hypothetical protein